MLPGAAAAPFIPALREPGPEQRGLAGRVVAAEEPGGVSRVTGTPRVE